jgi:diadenosine tetraphosphate (Ap4A) HIT family hydrolase
MLAAHCIALHVLLQALTRAVQKATGCAGVRVRQNNGPTAGQVVPQLHFHVIPVEGPEDEVREFSLLDVFTCSVQHI